MRKPTGCASGVEPRAHTPRLAPGRDAGLGVVAHATRVVLKVHSFAGAL